MRILINASNLIIGGGIQVAYSFIIQLKNFTEHTFTVVASEKLMELLEDHENVSLIELRLKRSFVDKTLRRNKELEGIIKSKRIECVFTVFGPAYWRPSVKHIVGYARPHPIYADSPYFEQLKLFEAIKTQLKGKYLLQSFKKEADCFVTESEDVTHRLKQLIGKTNVHTVTNTYNQEFESYIQQKTRFKEEKIIFTVLTISASYPHKNLKLIPKVAKLLKDARVDVEFVLSVLPSDIDLSDHECSELNIKCLGYISPKQVPRMYEEASVVLLPSLLECFSANYPEAMIMRRPIITSDLSFARSICDDAAIYVDTTSAKQVAEAITRIYSDKKLYKKKVENGLRRVKEFDTYESRANKYIDIIINETNNSIV